VPGRPNGRTGWIPAEAADLRPVRELIHIDLSAQTLEFRSKGRLALKTRVAVGRPGMETPRGLFYVTWKLVPRAPVLGKFAFETSAYSRLSEWPGGGIVGIHGTYEPQLLGQAVSHGCVRVSNRDILRLRARVGLGTPIRIVA
jgi:lipoprotein-anchoring transpeptidase ErfK/SrfK